MRMLFCGDVLGRSGRDAMAAHLPTLRRDLKLDFVVANGENAAAGFGITQKICAQLFELGVDVITGGNHSWDQREALNFINQENRLLRPINFPVGTPGGGAGLYRVATGQNAGKKVLVINAMGRLYMDPLDDPFAAVEKELAKHRLGSTTPSLSISTARPAAKKWPWVIFSTGGFPWWWAPIPMFPPPTASACPAARAIRPTRECAAIMIR